MFSALASKLSTKMNETVPSRQNFHLVRDIFKAKLQLCSQSVWVYIHFIFPPTTFLSHQSSSSSGLHFVILIWSIIVRKVLQQTTLEYTWGFEDKGGLLANFFFNNWANWYNHQAAQGRVLLHPGGHRGCGRQGRWHGGAGQQDRAQGGAEEGVDHLIIWTWPWHLTPVVGSGYLPACLLSMEDKQHCVHCLCCHNQKPSLVNLIQ